jgi:hypothetical protein
MMPVSQKLKYVSTNDEYNRRKKVSCRYSLEEEKNAFTTIGLGNTSIYFTVGDA